MLRKFPQSFKHLKSEIDFWYLAGTVVGSNKFSETHVSLTGGGGIVSGYVGPYGGNVTGFVSAPTLKSEVITNHEFWIRTREGNEEPIQFSGIDIPLRPEQKIVLISAHKKDESSGDYCAVVNQTADRFWIIRSPANLNQTFQIETLSKWYVLVSVIMALVIAALVLIVTLLTSVLLSVNFSFGAILQMLLEQNYPRLNPAILFTPAILAAAIYIFSRVNAQVKKVRALEQRLRAHLDSLIVASVKLV